MFPPTKAVIIVRILSGIAALVMVGVILFRRREPVRDPRETRLRRASEKG